VIKRVVVSTQAQADLAALDRPDKPTRIALADLPIGVTAL
jgi:hypothetical protein